MVATADNFERSKEFFDSGDILNTLESFNKVIENLDRSETKHKAELIQFLEHLLKYCQVCLGLWNKKTKEKKNDIFEAKIAVS